MIFLIFFLSRFRSDPDATTQIESGSRAQPILASSLYNFTIAVPVPTKSYGTVPVYKFEDDYISVFKSFGDLFKTRTRVRW
jgi:hypothetical protein